MNEQSLTYPTRHTFGDEYFQCSRLHWYFHNDSQIQKEQLQRNKSIIVSFCRSQSIGTNIGILIVFQKMQHIMQ